VLADRQGLFKGDLNDVQRACLSFLIAREREEADDREIRQFKQRMIAAHPEKGKEIEAMFAEQDTELAAPLSEEEMEDAGPLDANTIESLLGALRESGFAIEDLE
jgi:hypothetical protein